MRGTARILEGAAHRLLPMHWAGYPDQEKKPRHRAGLFVCVGWASTGVGSRTPAL